MADLADYRLSRQVRNRHRDGFEAVEVYSIPHALVDELEPQYAANAGNYWQNKPEDNPTWPQITQYRMEYHDPRMPGKALLTCVYSTPHSDDLIIQGAEVGEQWGYIQIVNSRQMIRAKWDYEAKGVNAQGFDPDAGPDDGAGAWYRWQPDTGSDLMPDNTIMMVLTVGLIGDPSGSNLNLYGVQTKIGRINQTAMGNFVNAEPKTLRLDGLSLERSTKAADVWLARLSFQYNSLTWDRACIASRYLKIARTVYPDDDTTKPAVRVVGWELDTAAGNVLQDRKMHNGEEDFGSWNAMVKWVVGDTSA